MSVAEQTSQVCVKCHQMENSKYRIRQQKMFRLEREVKLEFYSDKTFFVFAPVLFHKVKTNPAFKTKVLIEALENS